MLYQLCFVQQNFNCDEIVIMLNIYFHECNLLKQTQKCLTILNVCAIYDRTKNVIQKFFEHEIDQICIFDFLFFVIITIDNFDVKKNRNKIKIDNKFFFVLTTTVIINEKSNIFKIDLLKSMYNVDQSLRIINILTKKLIVDNIYKSIRFLINFLISFLINFLINLINSH